MNSPEKRANPHFVNYISTLKANTLLFLSKKICENVSTNNIVNFEQLAPGVHLHAYFKYNGGTIFRVTKAAADVTWD